MKFVTRTLSGLLLAGLLSAPAQAASPVPVVFGTTWDVPAVTLQSIVDSYLGAPGLINAATDYVGHDAGEPDPWFWIDSRFSAMLVREVAGYANFNVLGWYLETGGPVTIDGVNDGVVFNGPDGSGAMRVVVFPAGVSRFGFYLDPKGAMDGQNAPQPEVFFTNRFLNDLGADGSGAIHAPFDGDVQALVFDVSQWKGANTWLVAFEDVDYGAAITPCCSGTDNDYNDLVFEVKAIGATEARALTFGALKQRFRK